MREGREDTTAPLPLSPRAPDPEWYGGPPESSAADIPVPRALEPVVEALLLDVGRHPVRLLWSVRQVKEMREMARG